MARNIEFLQLRHCHDFPVDPYVCLILEMFLPQFLD